jgi:molybdenum cofactor cytidylyltransferase
MESTRRANPDPGPGGPDGVRPLAAIVLAAGLSRRMGGRNKLLLPVDGVPLVRRSVALVAAQPFAEVVVVTGHEADAVADALRGLPVRIVLNARYEEGQMTSVHRGLAALSERSPRAAGVMVCLADQPSLTAGDLRTIAAAFLERPGCAVLVPTFAGQRGNPIVLARASLAEILLRGGSFGCKQFIARNADLVTPLPMSDDHVVVDLDRPEDYARICPPT